MYASMQGEWFDGVLSKTTALWLQYWCDIGLQDPILTLNRTNFHLKAIGVMATQGDKEIVIVLQVKWKALEGVRGERKGWVN